MPSSKLRSRSFLPGRAPWSSARAPSPGLVAMAGPRRHDPPRLALAAADPRRSRGACPPVRSRAAGSRPAQALLAKAEGWAAALVLLLAGAQSKGLGIHAPDIADPQAVHAFIAKRSCGASTRVPGASSSRRRFFPSSLHLWLVSSPGMPNQRQSLPIWPTGTVCGEVRRARALIPLPPLLREFLQSEARGGPDSPSLRALQRRAAVLLRGAGHWKKVPASFARPKTGKVWRP